MTETLDFGHLVYSSPRHFNGVFTSASRSGSAEISMKVTACPHARANRCPPSFGGDRGLSLLELMFVLAVSAILLGVAIPSVMRAIRTVRLQESAIDYASLLQRARMRAVQDDRFYSVWVQAAAGGNPPIAYVDLNPKLPTGVSGHGDPATGGFYDPAPPTPDP